MEEIYKIKVVKDENGNIETLDGTKYKTVEILTPEQEKEFSNGKGDENE